MTANDRHNAAKQWLRYAREDVYTAEKLLQTPDVAARNCCFFAQQAAEKALKSLLILLEIDFLYRHDLEYLNSLLPDDLQLDEDSYDLEQLTQWAVVARYPGDDFPPNEADARSAVDEALRVVETIKERHRQRESDS